MLRLDEEERDRIALRLSVVGCAIVAEMCILGALAVRMPLWMLGVGVGYVVAGVTIAPPMLEQAIDGEVSEA